MGARWKGKGSKAKAESEPMSQIVSELQSSLIKSQARGLLSGSNVLVCLDSQEADLLNRACFGVPITNFAARDNNKQWFQLGPEEAFYLCNDLKCLVVHKKSHSLMTSSVLEDDKEKNSMHDEKRLWRHMKSMREAFPQLYKAYSHLRRKNWVVTSGVRYGADFVAYRHHPALVHSEFAVLVISSESNDARLAVWSDVHCAGRLCGGVAKTLMVIDVVVVDENSARGDDDSLSCLEGYSVSERTITRWLPEKCCEETSEGN